MKNSFVGLTVAVGLTFIFSPTFAKSAAKKVNGEQVYKEYCASCHTGGGNRIKPNHPVAGSKELNALVRFKAYLSSPPGHMPFYKTVVNDKQILQSLYKYCKQLKKPIKQASNRAVEHEG